MEYLQGANVRIKWWEYNFPTLAMFEDTFQNGIEKKIDFKREMAFITAIF